MGGLSCYLLPGSCVATSIGKATLGALFDALTSWILSSVHWMLSAAGGVLLSAAEPRTVLQGASAEFQSLLSLSPLLLLIGLLVSTLQHVRRGQATELWRLYLGVAPLSVATIFLARPLAKLILLAVNQLSTSAAQSVSTHEATLSKALLDLAAGTPGFALFLLAIGVVIGTFLLYCELVVRTVVLTLLLVLVPVIVPLSTFPSGRRLSARLAETFIAVAVSKFLIVITLALGLNELLGGSLSEVITGIVTLALATISPFVLLRVIPFIEQSALHNVEGLRRRATSTTVRNATPVASRALDAMYPIPGDITPPDRPEDLGIPMWPGVTPLEVPPYTGVPTPLPIVTPPVRHGHMVVQKDAMGPVIGWEWDD